MNLANISLIIVGLACMAFGILFAARRKARIFYGVNVRGGKAIFAGLFLALFGLAVIVFAIKVFPDLIDLDGILQDIPEFRNQ